MNTFILKDLTVEYAKNPIGLDCEAPRFGWKMEADYDQAMQKAYCIIVKDRKTGQIVWQTDRIEDSRSTAITYEGIPLTPCTLYEWTVTVWDAYENSSSQRASFETGLMNPSIAAWEGAKFIGQEKLSLTSSTLGIFRIETKLTIRPGGRCAGIVFGANDQSLPVKENYISYEIDITTIPARLLIYRVGYEAGDQADKPYAVADICEFGRPDHLIITEANKNQPQTLTIEVYGNHAKAFVDGIIVDQVQDTSFMARFSPVPVYNGRQLNPIGFNDVPTYPRLNDIGLTATAANVDYEYIQISNIRKPGAELFYLSGSRTEHLPEEWKCSELISLSNQSITLAAEVRVWITMSPDHGSVPMLRREFTISEEKELVNARLYVTARGIYKGKINGQDITDQLLNPGASQFDKHLFYQTYDITSHITRGWNAVGFYIASGWWSDAQTFSLMNYNYYGDRPSLLAKIVLEYSDGSREVIISEPENWLVSTEGPIRYAGYFNGEHYQAAREADYAGFAEPGYNKGLWESPVIIEPYCFEETKGFPSWPAPNRSEPKLTGSLGSGVRQIKTVPSIGMTEPKPGIFVFDLGQNMAGVVRIKIKGKAGQKIMIRHGEILYPELEEYKGLEGMLLTENLRDAMNVDYYICRGLEEETYMPELTFHGFRYVEITGVDCAEDILKVEGVVISSITEETGELETSNALLNKLFENIKWSQRANFISIPTDCPQRNERMGWMGDAQVFAKTASYNAQVYSFMSSYLQMARDLQEPNGKYPDIAPVGGGFGGICWESAGVIIPWEMYQQYGDKTIIKENYEAMKRFIAFLREMHETESYKKSHFLGDWLAADLSTDNMLIWNAMYAYDIELVAKMAAAIGQTEDAVYYSKLAAGARKYWNEKFIDTQNNRSLTDDQKINDTQCSYAMALTLDIISEENKEAIAKRLDEKTRELDYTLTTGFVGTGLICPALTDNGYGETAYRLVQQTKYPSWLYSVTQGATTIWERWNSFTIENGFGGNNHMNSFNHYSLGAIGAWMYSHMLGIRRDETQPGFHHFILKPDMQQLEYAKGHYDSLYGRIESGWTNKAGIKSWNIIIPANTTADVYLPEGQITEENNKLDDLQAMSVQDTSGKYRKYTLKSGSYHFTIR